MSERKKRLFLLFLVHFLHTHIRGRAWHRSEAFQDRAQFEISPGCHSRHLGVAQMESAHVADKIFTDNILKA